jgi:histone acetyltransferase 1
VDGKIKKILRGEYTSDLKEFTGWVAKEPSFVPLGKLVQSFKHDFVQNKKNAEMEDVSPPKKAKGMNGSSVVENFEKSYEIYVADAVSVPGFKDYVKKMETFILFFIDAASFLDCEDDDKWQFFTL